MRDTAFKATRASQRVKVSNKGDQPVSLIVGAKHADEVEAFHTDNGERELGDVSTIGLTLEPGDSADYVLDRGDELVAFAAGTGEPDVAVEDADPTPADEED